MGGKDGGGAAEGEDTKPRMEWRMMGTRWRDGERRRRWMDGMPGWPRPISQGSTLVVAVQRTLERAG